MKKMILIGLCMMVLGAMACQAATTNDVTGGSTAIASGLKTPVVLDKTVNFLTYPCAAGDVCKMIYIPTNFLVTAMIAECVTTNTGTASAFIVGDNTSTCTWMNTAISMVSADAAVTQCTNAFSNGGKLYTAPDFISIVPTIAITNGSARVEVLGVKF